MNLQPIPQAAISRHFDRLKLGRAELGSCTYPRPVYHGNVVAGTRECGYRIRDDGTNFADLDGRPFRAYVCAGCAAEVLGVDAVMRLAKDAAARSAQ